MSFGIVVFNEKTIDQIDEEELLIAVTESNFHTLCAQYKLLPDLFQQGFSRLYLKLLAHKDMPLFQLMYRSSHHMPLTVYRWPADSQNGSAYMEQMKNETRIESVQEYITHITQVVVIELSKSQLKDLGILLAYEIARWAVFNGNGIMYALDGKWYRLNENKAFLPIVST